MTFSHTISEVSFKKCNPRLNSLFDPLLIFYEMFSVKAEQDKINQKNVDPYLDSALCSLWLLGNLVTTLSIIIISIDFMYLFERERGWKKKQSKHYRLLVHLPDS